MNLEHLTYSTYSKSLDKNNYVRLQILKLLQKDKLIFYIFYVFNTFENGTTTKKKKLKKKKEREWFVLRGQIKYKHVVLSVERHVYPELSFSLTWRRF